MLDFVTFYFRRELKDILNSFSRMYCMFFLDYTLLPVFNNTFDFNSIMMKLFSVFYDIYIRKFVISV